MTTSKTTARDEEDVTAAEMIDRLLSYDERIARVEHQSSIVIERLKRQKAEYEEYALPVLADYYDRHRPRKGRTLHTVAGSIGYRTVKGGPRVADAGAAMDWAREHLPSAIVTDERLLKSEVISHVVGTGEIPPGVEITEDADRMYIKPPRGKDEDDD